MKKVAIIGIMAVILMVGVAVAIPAPATDAQVFQEGALVVISEVASSIEYVNPIERDGIVEVGERWRWNIAMAVTNNGSETIEDVVLKDNLGGELRLAYLFNWNNSTWLPVPQPVNNKDTYSGLDGLHVQWTGKTLKAHLIWDVGDLAPGETFRAAFAVQTDFNPGTGNGKKLGHQEYTEAGIHYLDSGATAKGMIDGLQLSVASNPFMVEVFEPD